MQHFFDVEIAEKYGLREAIIFSHLVFWIEKNRANEVNYYDGRYWTYCSNRALGDLFPYMTKKQINAALKNLRENKLILTGNYNRSSYDRTLWYALTDEGKCAVSPVGAHFPYRENAFPLEGKSISPIGKIDFPYRENPFPLGGTPIPDISTDISTDKKKRERAREKKSNYGQFENVRLTDTELEKIKARFPADWKDRIEEMSCAIESRGYKYKSHYAALLNWARRDAKREAEKQAVKKLTEPYKPPGHTDWPWESMMRSAGKGAK